MKLDQKGQTTLLLAVFIGGFVAFLGVNLMSRLQAAYKLENNLRTKNNSWQYAIEIGQMVKTAYDIGQTYSGACAGNPCPIQALGNALFVPVVLTNSDGTYTAAKKLLFPNNSPSLCADNFCIATQPALSVMALNNEEFYKESPHVIPTLIHQKNYLFDWFIPEAEAGSGQQTSPILPYPYLSPIPAAFPSNTATPDNCLSASNGNCMICRDAANAATANANCVKIRVCTNGSSSCPDPTGSNASTTPPSYIEPRFAFVSSG